MTLFHVMPCLTPHDAPDGSLRHVVLHCQLFVRNAAVSIALPNLCYLFAIQFRARARFTVTRSSLTSAFCLHVGRVFHWLAKEQMVRPYARRVVARMAHEHASRNRPMVQFPGHTMRQEHSMLPINLHAERPVSARHAITLPFPAAIRLPHFCPESLLDIAELCRTRIAALVGTVQPSRMSLWMKTLTAGETDSRRRCTLWGHWTLLASCVIPPAVTAARGLSMPAIIPLMALMGGTT